MQAVAAAERCQDPPHGLLGTRDLCANRLHDLAPLGWRSRVGHGSPASSPAARRRVMQVRPSLLAVVATTSRPMACGSAASCGFCLAGNYRQRLSAVALGGRALFTRCGNSAGGLGFVAEQPASWTSGSLR